MSMAFERPGPEPPKIHGSPGHDDHIGGADGGHQAGADQDDCDEESGRAAAVSLTHAVAAAEREVVADVQQESREERAARLDSDRRLVELLAREDFRGRGFERYARQLYAYGKPVLVRWLISGELFVKVNERRAKRNEARVARQQAPLPMVQPLPGFEKWTVADLQQLADDVLADGVIKFREALRRGKWDPSWGATLKTYFIGSCLWSFPKVYINWHKERTFLSGMLVGLGSDEVQTELLRAPQQDGPEHTVIKRDHLRRALVTADPELRRVLSLYALGFSQREAAQQCGLTAKAVEGRLRRWREQYLKSLKEADEPEGLAGE
ncbi:RNA polymerase sigma factor [Nonomuraea sp. NPDC050540]|uniref:RNA polymerase sigma factor n=1 Tax=Nonomuraea sp. NPDC050540 TaxID=3364367 RepID=UPI0037BD106E